MTTTTMRRTAAHADSAAAVIDESAVSLAGVRAVLLDVDGTLYRQAPVRLWMALEMATAPVSARSLAHGLQVIRTVQQFRKVREELRTLAAPGESLASLQFTETARRVGLDPAQVERTVSEWMFRRPLKYLPRAKRPGVVSFLESVVRTGRLVGALSDYPVADKLAALGLSPYFSLLLCTTEPRINAFKPHPRGFLEACRQWGVSPLEVLYVGDRPDVDATGAGAAGMRAAIIGRRARRGRRPSRHTEHLSVGGFAELETALAAR